MLVNYECLEYVLNLHLYEYQIFPTAFASSKALRIEIAAATRKSFDIVQTPLDVSFAIASLNRTNVGNAIRKYNGILF